MERELPTLDVMSADHAFDTSRMLAALPEGTPIARSERGLEVLGYRACQEAFANTSLTPCMPELAAVLGVSNQDVVGFVAEELNSREGAEHSRLRAGVAGFFAPARLRRTRLSAARIATEVIESIPAPGDCEAVQQIGVPVAARFFCRLLGVPDADADLVHRFSVGFSTVLRFEEPEAYQAFRDSVDSYLLALFRTRRADPGHDLVSHLMRAENGGNHSPEESLRLAVTMLGAGSDMVAAQIALMIAALTEHPEQWELVRQRDDLVTGAVLECARLRPTVFATERIARQDTELCGVPVRRGEFVFVHIIAGNQDPAIYPRADRLDITRAFTHPPLTWSVGRHFCLGRTLSLIAMEEVLRAIRPRWSTMRFTAAPTTTGQPHSVRPVAVPIAVDLAGQR
ncbi:cytochrome P450 [Goodfellowiella coeruleoviolacea]|uniref:cytochrome P450 n=1 Tax=Goodfellowiella coeruleoviolacea TaxID=334858 RepID=UPI0020A61AC4|nr:cytochrome P450 [Goodfellowiella coeruleoviolacea]